MPAPNMELQTIQYGHIIIVLFLGVKVPSYLKRNLGFPLRVDNTSEYIYNMYACNIPP